MPKITHKHKYYCWCPEICSKPGTSAEAEYISYGIFTSKADYMVHQSLLHSLREQQASHINEDVDMSLSSDIQKNTITNTDNMSISSGNNDDLLPIPVAEIDDEQLEANLNGNTHLNEFDIPPPPDTLNRNRARSYDINFQLPRSFSTLESWTGYNTSTSSVTKYIICTRCHHLYPITRNSAIPDNCTNVTCHRNTRCGQPLFHFSQDHTRHRTLKVFPYNSIRVSILEMFRRPNFEQQIEHWRLRRDTHQDSNRIYQDIYDGAVWTDIKDGEGISFSFMPRTILFTLNVDCFNPFASHSSSTYSTGAMYLTINNLPRDIRYHPENVILLGVLPSRKEPKTSQINNYLKLMVDELIELYNGMWCRTYSSRDQVVLIRAALLNVACDTPAARKISGFTSHSSAFTCHKCDHRFPYNNVERYQDLSDFTPFARRTKKKKLEHGDPFHTLFLGTAATMIDIWIEHNYFGTQAYGQMQAKAEAVIITPGYEDILKNVAARFAFMKGDQWKTWCLIYSPYLLKGVIPRSDYTNWLRFVSACRLVVKPSITLSEAKQAHDLFIEFGKGCASLYGPETVTPNMHFHTHLLETIEDFSNIYYFWLYPFERYNKLLKNINTNCKDSFEVTFMDTFLKRRNSLSFTESLYSSIDTQRLPNTYFDFLSQIAGYSNKDSKTLSNIQLYQDMTSFYQLSSEEYQQTVTGAETIPLIEIKHGRLVRMDPQHYEKLYTFYQKHAYPALFESATTILAGKVYRSARPHTSSGSYISAFFKESTTENVSSYPGQVQYFFEHTPLIDGQPVVHTFAFVRWFKNIGNTGQTFSDAGLKFWNEDFEDLNELAILPVQRIYGHVAIVKYKSFSSRARTNKILDQ
ncbi:hypothetical protein G6F37_010010 [Rhizopus arrhizus]|nr:hypothetical protein G6F38_009358 [Rhizopus arrhizus]KAG1153820.1 hypothetical protein G6F37_010010 [Rhizopus arrhizus]